MGNFDDIATLTGADNKAAEAAPLFSLFCGIFGKTVPFSSEELAGLYPSHDDFVGKYGSATFETVQSGHLLLEKLDVLFLPCLEITH
jgi:hypothetical protein